MKKLIAVGVAAVIAATVAVPDLARYLRTF